MPAIHRKGRPLRYATVLAVETQLRFPFADKTQIAASHGLNRKVVRQIEQRQTPAQKRVTRCGGCGGKLINKSKPCRVCPLRHTAA